MVKKNCFYLFLSLAFLFAGCVSTQPVELQPFPAEKELYPAVYGAVNEKYPGSRFTDIDFYNNIYKLENTVIYDGGLLLKRFDTVIKLLPTGFIEFTYENMYMQDSKTRQWTRTQGFLFFNWNNFASGITTKIVEIANTPTEYEKWEKAAMADIHFVYAIMKNFTGLAFNDFINNYAKGSVFVLEGAVSDVKEFNSEKNGIRYKYLVTMSQRLVENDTYLSSSFNNYIYCMFYTNRDDVIRLSKTSVYRISATLVGASQGSIGNSVVLELVAND
jgi:hypothetical protein